MATPTDEQQLRSTLRRSARRAGDREAVAMAFRVLEELFPDVPLLPPIMGAAEAAEILNMKATNLKRLSPPLPVADVVSGRIPVYLASKVEAARQRRLEQGRLRGSQPELAGAS